MGLQDTLKDIKCVNCVWFSAGMCHFEPKQIAVKEDSFCSRFGELESVIDFSQINNMYEGLHEDEN